MNIATKTGPNLFKALQYILFANGYRWVVTEDKEIREYNSEFLCVSTLTKTIFHRISKKDLQRRFQDGHDDVISVYNTEDFLDKVINGTTIFVKLNEEYEAIATKNGITVGCQKFEWEVLEKLMETKKQF